MFEYLFTELFEKVETLVYSFLYSTEPNIRFGTDQTGGQKTIVEMKELT